MYIEKFGRVLMVLGLAGLFAFSTVQATFAQSRINDKVSRNNGASFFANERTSRNLQHARSYTRGIQRYSTQAPVIQPQISQAESQMLGQQLQSIQRDLVIVREEHASNPKVVEQIKKMETQLGQATTVQKSLHEECCKASPDGKSCAAMCEKIHASLDSLKMQHDKLLKELGHEDAAHEHQASDHEHHDHGGTENKNSK